MKIELPVRHYRGVPASRPEGLATTTWTLDPARTALIELHCWNFGFPGAPPVPEEYWVFMGSTQNHDRMLGVVTQVIAPLLEAGRRAGIPIVHVQPESVARRYPELVPSAGQAASLRPKAEGGRRTAESDESGSSALRPARQAGSLPHSPVSDDASRRSQRVHGEGYTQWEGWSSLDVAEPVRPRLGDTMIVTTQQFDDWLRERGITTLIYTGFATNLCILESPAAMKPMRGLGYRCIIVREATMAVEFPDTLETLTHTRAAVQYIEAWVGYSTGAGDLMRALRGT
jgi:nicotinamidase-related amidase